MSSIANVVVLAALAMGVGGAVAVASLADSAEPPRVGDPIVLEVGGSGAPTDGSPTSTPRPRQADDDHGRTGDDDRGEGSGDLDDDGVDEIFPHPRILDDDGDDGGDDGPDDDTDERGDD